jgi:hypothetical protein
MNTSPSAFDPDPSRYPELRKWVVGCLSGHKKPNDIIFQLCHRTGWDWNQSKRFVEQVAQLDQRQVLQNRVPFMLAIGILGMAGGTFVTITGINNLQKEISTLVYAPDFLDFLKLVFTIGKDPLEFLLHAAVIVGPAMFLGGAWGIYSAIKSALTGEGDDLMQSGPNQPDRR